MCSGMVERFNGVLKNMLKRMCREQVRQWPRFINPLLFAYREVPHSCTKFSPFEFIYDHTVQEPLSLLKDMWEDVDQDTKEETRTTYEHIIDLREGLQDNCRIAQEEMEKSGEVYQSYYDKHAEDRS